jgi:hypothetical protein
MNGAYPLPATHIELRKHPKWHGGTLPPGIMVDKRGEPIYGTGAPEAGQEVPGQDASGS